MAHLLVVKPVSRENLLLMEQHLPYGPPEKHAERLKRQEKGEVTYLVAWYDGVPVGHALLKWRGATEAHLVSHFQGSCPDVEDLLVDRRYRSRGIGTQLLQAAERLVADSGFRQIGLAVDTRNKGAHNLYKRLGFRSIGLPPHHERGEYVDQNGRPASWEEVCIYMVKTLNDKGVDRNE